MTIFEDIVKDKAGDHIAAAVEIARALMVSDAASCKVGYSDENAVYAAQKALGLSEEDRTEALRILREEWRPGDITFHHGLYDGVRYGDHEEWYVYRRVNDDDHDYWNPIMGPFDTEVAARVAYAQKQEEWSL